MPDPLNIFAIDGTDVNAREDWRHRPPATGLTGKRYEGFPGYGGSYRVMGTQTGITLVIEGYLEAATFAELHTQLLLYEAMKSTPGFHAVTIHAISYADLVLDNFEAIGEHRPFGHASNTTWQSVRVRFTWKQLVPISAGGEA